MLAALEAHLLCHPTNLAFRDNVLFTTNLGRWPITAIETRAEGPPALRRLRRPAVSRHRAGSRAKC
jgi:hypothetical protein